MGVVAKIEAWPVNVPLEATYLMAPGVYPGISRTVVRVTTEDGVVGLGETPSPDDAALLVGELGAAFVGREADALREELGAGAGPSVARVDAAVATPNAAAGVEIALWDIAAREADVPCELLGPVVREEIPFTEYFARAARAARRRRPRSRSTAPAWSRSTARRRSRARRGLPAEADLETCGSSARRSVRTACCGSTRTWAGASTTARQMLAALEPSDANVEEPVASFAELASCGRLPGSLLVPHSRSERAHELGVPDTIVVGVGACGGIAGTLRFVERCAELGVGFWFYSGDLGIATAAQLHVTAVSPPLDRPSQSLLRWTADDVTEQGVRRPEGGVLAAPGRPGLGVTLDERALARCVER